MGKLSEELMLHEDKYSTGYLIDKLFELRGNKKEIEDRLDEVEEDINSLSDLIVSRMKEDGTNKVSTDHGTVSLNQGVAHPKVSNKEQFFKFISDMNRPELAIISVNKAGFKEYFDQYGQYPAGVDVFFTDDIKIASKRGK